MEKCRLGIQGSYKHFEIALKYKNVFFLDRQENFNISEKFIPYLNTLLKQYSLTINDVEFIALDIGPGAFTSLRATIASCNGLSFASGIPMIGIDGLDALVGECFKINLDFFQSKLNKQIVLVGLLNAYNNDVYYSINEIVKKDNKLEMILVEPKSYKNINNFIFDLNSRYKEHQFYFVGNAFSLHKAFIIENLGNKMLSNDFNLEVGSAEFILRLGEKYFNNKENLSRKLLPLYLKTQQFKLQIT